MTRPGLRPSSPEAKPSPGQARPGRAHRQAFQGLWPGLIFDKAQASGLGPGLSSVEGPAVAANLKRQLHTVMLDANNNATLEISIHRNKPPPSAITQKPAQLISKQAADNVGSLLADECAPDEGAMEDGPHESILFNATACTCNVLDRHQIHGARGNAHRQVQTFDASFVNAHTFVGTLDSEGFECINDTHTTVSDPSSAILLEDIDVQDISTTMKAHREDKTMDVSAFFGAPYAAKLKDGKTCNVRDCKSCCKKGLPHQITLHKLSLIPWPFT
ncbi:uncharacterized protein EDB91DRAFT_1085222 [Suillus paluster]|uniref:uncharacterized protein n=1 Tax=Suillus paluster TaxID=48578 RepID=UPI001B85F440|nr:uncharacterized protein EDB91DRAFT_1085222 [Suillus paluster]KAG1731110.1 hypothetical protein EDB91DRAFT_1085222 [Suillus paluster]